MTKQLWINLPVKDLARSKNFFTSIGFKVGARQLEDMISLEIGDPKVMVMLCAESTFTGSVKNDVSTNGSEVLISIDAETRKEVDDYARKAEEAGGKIFAAPSENQGWMYGCGFEDPDGHRWNVLYMDMSKMPG